MFYESQQLGEFKLIEKLGRGGFGEVWLAEKEDELFAIKLPYKDQVDWKQITQEIGLWTLCGKHKNVLPLIGAQNFNGQIAIISEYAPDGSLEDLLRKKGKLSVEEAVEMTIGVLEGLQHLHESGIIHRDLKPANILLNGKTPRLTDFGISRIITADSLSETISGTWAYMAPECFDGKRNIQTDIWSVGVILYRMIAGKLPFPQKEQTALLGAIIMNTPKPLPTDVPKWLAKKVWRMLSESTNRYGTAEEIQEGFLEFIGTDLSVPYHDDSKIFNIKLADTYLKVVEVLNIIANPPNVRIDKNGYKNFFDGGFFVHNTGSSTYEFSNGIVVLENPTNLSAGCPLKIKFPNNTVCLIKENVGTKNVSFSHVWKKETVASYMNLIASYLNKSISSNNNNFFNKVLVENSAESVATIKYFLADHVVITEQRENDNKSLKVTLEIEIGKVRSSECSQIIIEIQRSEHKVLPTQVKESLSGNRNSVFSYDEKDEKRFHNHARRFARLLVSEIKLWNEKKVIEGRNAGDLYGHLREAIDRAREMYDKRVESSVAVKIDYFHKELVSSLAEGDENKLGSAYFAKYSGL